MKSEPDFLFPNYRVLLSRELLLRLKGLEERLPNALVNRLGELADVFCASVGNVKPEDINFSLFFHNVREHVVVTLMEHGPGQTTEFEQLLGELTITASRTESPPCLNLILDILGPYTSGDVIKAMGVHYFSENGLNILH